MRRSTSRWHTSGALDGHPSLCLPARSPVVCPGSSPVGSRSERGHITPARASPRTGHRSRSVLPSLTSCDANDRGNSVQGWAHPPHNACRSASSTRAHRVETRRMSSTFRARASSSAGEHDQVRQAPGAGDRDVEAVAAEQEPHVAGHVLAGRGRHREEHHGRLLPLELVDGPDPDARPAAPTRSIRTCALYGATTMMSAAVSGRVLPSLVGVVNAPRAARSRRRSRRASSRDEELLPVCATGRYRMPVPAPVACRAQSGWESSRPS